MNYERQQLVETIQNRIQSYLNSRQCVGLGVGVLAAESDCMVFGGKVSAEHEGLPDQNTLFEIGSLTKVFTTMLLADMHVAGELSLDDPVNRLLPARARLVCRRGEEVTVRHLATHTSGLPRLPVNLTWKALGSDNPYAGYTAEDLYAGLSKCRLKSRPGTNSHYSNLGSGLLGHVLAVVGGADYERLVIDRVELSRLRGVHPRLNRAPV